MRVQNALVLVHPVRWVLGPHQEGSVWLCGEQGTRLLSPAVTAAYTPHHICFGHDRMKTHAYCTHLILVWPTRPNFV